VGNAFSLDMKELASLFAKEDNVTISIESFQFLKDVEILRQAHKVFNAERHGMETKAISEMIRDKRLHEYLETKRHAQNELKIASKLGKEILFQKTLS